MRKASAIGVMVASALSVLSLPVQAQTRRDDADLRRDTAESRRCGNHRGVHPDYFHNWGQRGLVGPNIRYLTPELRDTVRGRRFVIENYDQCKDGWIGREEVRAANQTWSRGARGSWREPSDERRDDRRGRRDR